MPQWITLAITILNAVIQIIKLVISLNQSDAQKAKETPAALKSARKEGDVTKILEIFSTMKKD